MNDRKQHVMNIARQLFVNNGFQTTSIQEIIEQSGISKGTFYNYFSSKKELLISIINDSHEILENERNQLLLGQSPTDVDIFKSQILLSLDINKRFQLITLVQEIFYYNDPDLNDFIERIHLKDLKWLYRRLIDLFGEEAKPYLLDCSIMFYGMLHQNLRFYFMNHSKKLHVNEYQVVNYTINRLLGMVKEVSMAKEILLEENIFEHWYPSSEENNIERSLEDAIAQVKKVIKENVSEGDQDNILELVNFLEEELKETKQPRKFVIESVLTSLGNYLAIFDIKELQQLQKVIEHFLTYEK
ncbi:TetR family transcriptional regulator [Bacillus ginsengihumi]|uniref:TetR family transcriptional regulator n=1 Tax=Heyndrickxia ginsengihumi TaxID=363870 RepID=A0A6M0P7A0_9BACI|nr:TetR/AcrR family transcriptional regulator [Heyndrickxia ginsengihumi]MBE6183112.1 TetR family transcriptional regulator [Bacillus sp. (in: firmicutes)]NEY20572.1 TetR family transcriptional regulator [Heyndrickxia ginsengihumi]